ncbi:hypothetical protein DSECCO2_540120 [anaerobic digester metagenome]
MGTLIKGISSLVEASFARSIDLPLPTPSKKVASVFRAFSINLSTSSMVALHVRTVSVLFPASSRSLLTLLPATS